MICKVTSEQIPRDLLLLADPEWSLIEQYLVGADCYGYRQNQQLVGIVVLTWIAEGVREIKNIAVNPAYQHRGIAKALLATSIERCQQESACREVQIGTGNSSLRQLSIYQHAGFDLFDVWVNFFVDNYPEPIFEDGLQCKSMVRLRMATDLDEEEPTNVANG